MSDDNPREDFAARLGAVRRRDLAGSLREEIMAAAYPVCSGKVVSGPWWKPPRWMAAGLAACWLAIAVLQVLTPEEKGSVGRVALTVQEPGPDHPTRRELLAVINMELER